MITNKDVNLLSHLRTNARQKVTEISKSTGMPATTIYGRIKVHETSGLVKKHVALIDFSKLGYTTTSLIALKVEKEKREQLENYLSAHPNMNSLYRINYGHDFLVEMVFENMSRLQCFLDETEMKFSVEKPVFFNIINELKKEVFLSRENIEKDDVDKN
ncbi:Lrp/AsnC family transcriptional regulator [Candidatus Woesearchaeota archaeon]|nr:Lrp/AsnC family transcriptional regulator [Candidatus Woesearchaeota archaeon]